MNTNIEELVKKHTCYDSINITPAYYLRKALTEQSEAFKGELQAYDGTVRELTKTVEDMRAAQFVPVAGEPTDAAYKWMIANGVEPMTSLHKLGERLAALLDEDQFSECEALLLTAITAINTFVPVPAAELATLREKAAEADELRKDAEKWRDLCSRVGADPSGIISYAGPLEGAPEDWAAIAQEKGE